MFENIWGAESILRNCVLFVLDKEFNVPNSKIE